ncbi:ABC transporter ATP-binding protein [Gordonia sp. NPDC003422]
MSLIATGLSRSFRGHFAVEHADIALRSGVIHGLVGPNGAGKTTLLLMLAGLLAPDTGQILLDDEPVGPDRARQVTGWMPDVFGTWDALTAKEILTTFARLYGQTARDAKSRADELLAMVHLSEFAGKPAHVLSRGQKQRLGFARALVNRPRILLLDEPASGMDPRSRLDLRDQLRELADGGCTVLVSSHILSELSEMVDDVVMMTEGRTRPTGAATGHSWRIRLLGQTSAEAETLEFADDEAAAEHLTRLVAHGAHIAEFSRVSNELEDAYLALDPERR